MEVPRLFLGCAAAISVTCAAVLVYLGFLFPLELADLCVAASAYREACDVLLIVLSVGLHLLWFYCALS